MCATCPRIVVTLGMSFVWLGIAVLILLPSPGGKAPEWLKAMMSWQTPFIPFPIIAASSSASGRTLALMHSSYRRHRCAAPAAIHAP